MKHMNSRTRRLTLQSLERRCVLDGAGIEPTSHDLDTSLNDTENAWIASASSLRGNASGYSIEFGEDGIPKTVPADELGFEAFGSEAWSAMGGEADLFLLSATSSGDESLDRLSADEMLPGEDDFAAWNQPMESSFNADVDGSGQVTPLDVLMLINAINRNGVGESQLDASFEAASTAAIALDIDGDNQVGPLDVLYIINELNRQTEQFSQWEELDSFMTQPPEFADEASGDAMDWSTTLPALDFADLEDPRIGSRMAGSMFVTATKSDGTSYLVSVDDSGTVTAINDGESADVEVGEDQLIRIDGEMTGLGIGSLGGGYLLLPISARVTDFTFAWPWLVDDALASM